MIVHVCAAALGHAVVLRSAPWTLTAVQILGGGYLGWLAVSTLRARHRPASSGPDVGTGSLLRRAVLTNLTNPKVILFFAAFLPQFSRRGQGPVAVQLLILGMLFLLMGLLCDSVIGLTIGRLGRAFAPGGRATTILSAVAALTFATLSCLLLVEGVASV
jgi:threonine/homoserine/homoserine lactone efflux protein